MEGEVKYRTLFDSANDALLIMDMQGNIIDVNSIAHERLGYTREEMQHMNIAQIDHSSSRATIPSRIKQLQEHGQLVAEIAHVKKDGTAIPVEINARVIKLDGKDVIFSVVRDIIEQKRAAQTLRDQEEKYRMLFESAKDGIFIVDETGFIDCNKRGADMYGLTKEQLIGRSPAQMSPERQPDGRISAKAIMSTIGMVMSGAPQQLEWQSMRADGSLFDVEITLNRIDLGGKACLHCIARDITERKQAEEDLKESREQLRTVVEKSPFSMALVNMRGDIEYINLKAIETFGYLPQDIPSMDSWWAKAYPDKTYRDQVRAQWMGLVNEALLNKHEIEKREYRVTCKDGAVKSVMIFGVWVGDKVLTVFDDITERKKAEQALRESGEKFRNLFDNSEIAMFRTRLDGSEVLDVNQKWLDLVGITREQALGKPSVIVWEDPKERERMVGMLLAKGSVSNFEFNMLSSEKGVRNCVTSLRLYREQDILEGSIADITERKQLEEQSLRAQKLESIGTLAGGIAHDFNNLLQGVFGYISLAKMTISDKEKCTSSLERAEKALHQTVNLTNQLLTFSKGGKPAKKVIDLRPVIENSATFMLSGSRSDLRLNIPEGLWQVEADEGQIGQVIQNIVLNADQSMPIGGTVSIKASNLAKVDTALPPGLDKFDFVLITIQDTGVGIPGQYLSKIFDPYFTTKEKGSGLGLATSYSIIKNHGGMIDVRTKSGVGSTFMIYLPATTRPIYPEPAETSHTVAPLRRLKILVMDDEEVIRNISSELLDALGHDVEVVEDGHAALEKYQCANAAGCPFDIVILDLTIRGGMGGVDTIQKLLEMSPQVKAIVSSGYSDDAATANYLSQGFKASLKKPYDVNALKDVIDKMLNS